jgi:hypothetical protein
MKYVSVLASVVLALGSYSVSAQQTLLLRTPDISAEHLAFVYAGDIWLANRNFMKQVIHEDVGLYNQWKNSIAQHSPAFNDMIESITGDLQ